MSRRRYLSTEVSIDPRLADLIAEYGDFAGLLYTWLIPHAADDATLPRDPRVVLMAVVPGLGKSAQDVLHALEGMVALGLLEPHDETRLRFPSSFFKHQSYIKGDRRGTPQPARGSEPEPPAPHQQRKTAQNAADQREDAQNVASFSFTSPVPDTPQSPTVTAPQRGGGPREKPKGDDDAPDMAPLFEAFKALGLPRPIMPGKKGGSEAGAARALLKHFPPGDLAQCWQDIASGEYGDGFAQHDLSFTYLANRNRVANWQTWKTRPHDARAAPAHANGRPPRPEPEHRWVNHDADA